ncbi:MAG: hypothetical protein IIZ73_07510, partial [Ruminococcus sp.]|nr:hypothetical protein [Ruminococcus sp.]
GFLLFVDSVYLMRIVSAVTRSDNPIVVDANSLYINTAQTVVTLHIVFICITGVLLALLPLYSKAIRKINTSIDLEYNGSMEEIDISDEDR